MHSVDFTALRMTFSMHSSLSEECDGSIRARRCSLWINSAKCAHLPYRMPRIGLIKANAVKRQVQSISVRNPATVAVSQLLLGSEMNRH